MAPFDTLLARTSPWVFVLGGLLLAAVGFWIGIRAARWVLRHRVGRTRRVGHRGEARARKLLDRAGYRILESQVTAYGVVEADGEDHEYVVRADALVKRRGRRYVAEFKAGTGSSTIAHRDTRRQVLEYAFLFDVDGVLLVDADSGRIHRIRFPDLPAM